MKSQYQIQCLRKNMLRFTLRFLPVRWVHFSDSITGELLGWCLMFSYPSSNLAVFSVAQANVVRQTISALVNWTLICFPNRELTHQPVQYRGQKQANLASWFIYIRLMIQFLDPFPGRGSFCLRIIILLDWGTMVSKNWHLFLSLCYKNSEKQPLIPSRHNCDTSIDHVHKI